MNDRPETRLPEDPTGIDEPHDVLAAEEFAMPAAGVTKDDGRCDPRTLIPGLVLGIVLLTLLRRLRR